MITVNGRYPYKQGAIFGNIITNICNASKEDITIRIDDSKNIDFWLEINLTKQDLEYMLSQVNKSEE